MFGEFAMPSELRSNNLLPSPFDWVRIPHKGYSIAKYPVTNAQFAAFIEAGGYQQRQWWTDTGWKIRESKSWTEPRFWTDEQWNGLEQPVVGVSWHEAVAFCLWLSDATGERIMLPTADQWQFAAQGDDGRAYPWGNDWDCECCNNSVSPCKSTTTTPVRLHEGKNDSPFGVVDMAGNVWEWCTTSFQDRSNAIDEPIDPVLDVRLMWGGSWRCLETTFLRCDYYFPAYALHDRNDWGFRLVLH